MKMYQFEKDFDFHALGREIKRKRKDKGWTQEYLAQLLDRTPRSIMYMENRGQHPSLNILFKIATLLHHSVSCNEAIIFCVAEISVSTIIQLCSTLHIT